MDRKSKELMNLIQANFPIETRPFLRIANQLNITEEQAISMIKELKDKGYIRRIGGILDSKKLGYYSTLCAMQVPIESIPEVTSVINSYNEVTHNYIREHSYNIWFTVIAHSKEKVKDLLEEIKIKTSISDILNLPAIDIFKINVNFNIKE